MAIHKTKKNKKSLKNKKLKLNKQYGSSRKPFGLGTSARRPMRPRQSKTKSNLNNSLRLSNQIYKKSQQINDLQDKIQILTNKKNITTSLDEKKLYDNKILMFKNEINTINNEINEINKNLDNINAGKSKKTEQDNFAKKTEQDNFANVNMNNAKHPNNADLPPIPVPGASNGLAFGNSIYNTIEENPNFSVMTGPGVYTPYKPHPIRQAQPLPVSAKQLNPSNFGNFGNNGYYGDVSQLPSVSSVSSTVYTPYIPPGKKSADGAVNTAPAPPPKVKVSRSGRNLSKTPKQNNSSTPMYNRLNPLTRTTNNSPPPY